MPGIPTIAQAAADIAAGRLSPVALTEACLDRIDRHEANIRAFIRLECDLALAAAKTAEAEIKAGHHRGPLHGIPLAHKDIYETAGIPTTCNSRLLTDYVPARDAFTVAKLRDAGIVMLGKLATYEFAAGGPGFDLPWPPARNPWALEHFTGGSSSGTGAAVAAGFILGGTGSCTGGSIRLPAAYCGLAGIKPTYGLVSRRGIQPLAFTLDHAGPLAWTVEDCAVLLQVMAGHDPDDPGSANTTIPDYTVGLRDGIKGQRIGVIRHFYEKDLTVSSEVGAAMDKSLEVLNSLGASIRDVTLPPLQDNISGTPALAICNGYSASGLPLSLQIVGRPFEDAAVLRAGHAYEMATPWKERRPAVVTA
jgi:aspartyl-tRNA(Asn)/glutamyl-tRNA(Gln) amidotransferase subunit A